MIVSPLLGTAEAKRCEKPRNCESFEAVLATDLAAANMETVEKPNKIIISWEEVMTAYTITIDGISYELGVDFEYSGFAKWTVWNPTGENHPLLGFPLGEIMELKVNYVYDFSAVPEGIDGKIRMIARIKMEDINEFFIAGNMKIKSLWGTGDLRNTKIEATNGGAGNPNHIGTVCSWPTPVTQISLLIGQTPATKTKTIGDKYVISWGATIQFSTTLILPDKTHEGISDNSQIHRVDNLETDTANIYYGKVIWTYPEGTFEGKIAIELRKVSEGALAWEMTVLYCVLRGTGDFEGQKVVLSYEGPFIGAEWKGILYQ